MRSTQTRGRGLAGVILLALSAAACGSDEESSSTTAAPAATAAPSTPAGFEAQWAELIAAAQAEGELVVVGVSRVVEAAAVEEAFSEQFGIDITVSTGSGNDLSSRILAERAQGLYTVDVALFGNIRIVEAEVFKPLEPELVHPEALDRSTGWRIDSIPWAEAEQAQGRVTLTQIERNTNPIDIWYNTENVTEEEIAGLKSWYDFLDPKWKGRIGIGNVADGESSAGRGITWLTLGEEYWDRFVREVEPQVVAYADARAYADGLARGSWDIAMFGGSGDDAVEELIDLGQPIEAFPHTLALAEDEPAPAGFADLAGDVAIFDRAPHPNAARLYVNWFLSREGATAYNAFAGEGFSTRPHLRNDVPQGIMDDAAFEVLPEHIFDRNNDEFRAAFAESLEWWIGIFDEVGLNP